MPLPPIEHYEVRDQFLKELDVLHDSLRKRIYHRWSIQFSSGMLDDIAKRWDEHLQTLPAELLGGRSDV